MAKAKQDSPAQTDEFRQAAADQAAIVAVTLLLLAGYSFAALSQGLIALLAPLGIPPAVTGNLILLLGIEGLMVPPSTAAPGSATAVMTQSLVARRAMYVVTAAKRMTEGGTIEVERKNYGAHLLAERRRTEAVNQVDQQASVYGQLLGWHAKLDNKTTPLCRAAHGRNFEAGRPPQIGYPGVAHAGNCRCRAGKPFHDGTMLPVP